MTSVPLHRLVLQCVQGVLLLLVLITLTRRCSLVSEKKLGSISLFERACRFIDLFEELLLIS